MHDTWKMYAEVFCERMEAGALADRRIDWIDRAKGMAVFLVVLGHTPVPAPLVREIYTFHMPLFFFLSGWVFRPERYRGWRDFAANKARSLLVPYTCFGLLRAGAVLIAGWAGLVEPGNPLELFGGIAVSLRKTAWSAGLWFLPCLFVSEMLFYGLLRLARGSGGRAAALFLAASLAGGVYATLGGPVLPWGIDVSCTCAALLGVGYLTRTCAKRLRRCARPAAALVLLAVNLASGALHFAWTGRQVDLYAGEIGLYPLFWIAALSGIGAAVIAAKLLHCGKLLGLVGRNSIIFYALHQSLALPLVSWMAARLLPLPESPVLHALYWLGVAVLACGLLVPVSVLIAGKLPFLLGRCRPARQT